MEIFQGGIEQYIADHTSSESEALAALNRHTQLKVLMPQMLSGKVQGKVLEFISIMMRPQNILEIGTFTGYSGICLARGLQPGGKIYTIDINDELTPTVKEYVTRENLNAAFEIITGDALQIIPTLQPIFDLVFIDADKKIIPITTTWCSTRWLQAVGLLPTTCCGAARCCMPVRIRIPLPSMLLIKKCRRIREWRM